MTSFIIFSQNVFPVHQWAVDWQLKNVWKTGRRFFTARAPFSSPNFDARKYSPKKTVATQAM
jgi:hypothetical protein